MTPRAFASQARHTLTLAPGKAAVAAQRNERLAHRNPEKLQTQIEELRARQSEHGQLPQRDQAILAGLERDVGRIRKAKAALGHSPSEQLFAGSRAGERDGAHRQVLGKRPRGSGTRHVSPPSSDTDEEARSIPMPRDTPPPIPRRHFDRRRAGPEQNESAVQSQQQAPAPTTQVVYESKPVIRDLRKEAIGLVPSVVKRKLDAVRGGLDQPLLEEDELDRLEKEGYGIPSHQSKTASTSVNTNTPVTEEPAQHSRTHSRRARVEDADDDG